MSHWENKLQYSFRFCHVILLMVSLRIKDTNSFRKIKDGESVQTSMRFMVYLTKAEPSPTLYDAWICGGAIVSKDFIVTSAACVEDVQYMYAIAGYSKYISAKNIATDPCTKHSRKKVVFICVPKSYEFSPEKVEKWAFIDIAAVKVESPYNFASSQPAMGCSWVPNKIDINYNPKQQEPDTDAMILGWGHAQKWRQPGDTTDYNQENLHYAPIKLMDKGKCKESYQNSYPEMLPIIDKYMFCAMDDGLIDERGDFIRVIGPDPDIDGCVDGGKCVTYPNLQQQPPSFKNLKGDNDKAAPAFADLIEDIEKAIPTVADLHTAKEHPITVPGGIEGLAYLVSAMGSGNKIALHKVPKNFASRPNPYMEWLNKASVPPVQPYPQYMFSNLNMKNVNMNPQAQYPDITFDDLTVRNRRENNETASEAKLNYTRKAGICQNDHGGPILTWVGKHEVLIGVASVFKVNEASQCVGPYLFTSTQCNGAFLDCVVNQLDVTEQSTTVKQKSTTTPPESTEAPATLFLRATRNGKKPLHLQPAEDDETYFFTLGRRSKSFCDLPPKQRGFDIVNRRVSWRNHPDGPAQSELEEDLFERPSLPFV